MSQQVDRDKFLFPQRDAVSWCHDKVDLAFQDLGEQTVKNIPEPLRVYRVAAGTAEEDMPVQKLVGMCKVVIDLPARDIGD